MDVYSCEISWDKLYDVVLNDTTALTFGRLRVRTVHDVQSSMTTLFNAYRSARCLKGDIGTQLLWSSIRFTPSLLASSSSVPVWFLTFGGIILSALFHNSRAYATLRQYLYSVDTDLSMNGQRLILFLHRNIYIYIQHTVRHRGTKGQRGVNFKHLQFQDHWR